MNPPETAILSPTTGLLSDRVSCISGRRPDRACPGRGGEAVVGQRTGEVARTVGGGSGSRGAADPASARCGRDGATTRLGHGAPPADRVGCPFVFAAAGEGHRVVAGTDQAPGSPSPGRCEDPHSPGVCRVHLRDGSCRRRRRRGYRHFERLCSGELHVEWKASGCPPLARPGILVVLGVVGAPGRTGHYARPTRRGQQVLRGSTGASPPWTCARAREEPRADWPRKDTRSAGNQTGQA